MKKPSEIKVNRYTLAEILERHLHWLNRDCDGWESLIANLSDIDLSDVDLSNANLSCANLYNINLCNADLCNANLSYTHLRNVDLSNANLKEADLHNATLYSTDLSNADMTYANLSCANLHSTNLSNVDLHCANLFNTSLYNTDLSNADIHSANLFDTDLGKAKAIPYIPLACPSDGAFIGWKKVSCYLVKLEIPASAKRCSSTTRKCRASKAKVLGIYTLNGEKTNLKNILNTGFRMQKLDYIVGKTIYPDYYDEDRWNECSHGIHFFINKQDAIDY